MTREDDNGKWAPVEKANFGLDVFKLLVSTAMTVAIFSVGHSLDAQKDSLSRQQHVDDQRIALWDKMGPTLT